MRQAGIVSLCAVVMLAIGALCAGVAVAANPEFIPKKGEFPDRVTDEAAPVTIETTSGAKVECERSSNEGDVEDAHSLSVKLMFIKCKSMGFNCTGPGLEAGLIEASATGTIGYIKEKPATEGKQVGLELIGSNSMAPFSEFNCGVIKVIVEGALVGELTPTNTANVKEFVLTYKQTAGTQELNTLLLPLGNQSFMQVLDLRTSIGGGGFTLSGEQARFKVLLSEGESAEIKA